MKLSSFVKKFSIGAVLFLAFFILPNPVLDKHVCKVKASEVEIDDDVSKIKLNVKSKSCIVDETYTLKVYRTTRKQKISFKSNDSSIITVKKTSDKEAEIVANEVGEATVTVTVKEGSKTVTSLKCDVTVTPPALSVKLIDGKLKLSVDDKVSLKKDLKPSITCETPTYISTRPNVVTVSSRGVVTAVGEGSAYVYASIANGTYDRCYIEVVKE
ncbi:Ig-like domain-containing protein [[Clostridium] polysaccharolyticum]|uniref:Ig-like domain (Group 2) n=1 Tax=[Clostridium] polysaccharolyticum TaxID=29364 RepID=A0A1H9ZGN1_9FIRM|nr:Ig-like domain-containing protein [[Clostridium] polysaccharolyticum]SES80479.1 Ig-like domain (group 2) [[Clostridium] polysaccharolyticum]